MSIRLFDEEMVGVDRLRILGDELYREKDPTDDFVGIAPFEMKQTEDEVVVELRLPFVQASEVDVFRHGPELYVTVGPYRRSFVLPDSLRRRSVLGAAMQDGHLEIRFTSEMTPT